MIREVEEFLKETKISYKQFDRLLDFFYFKDTIAHKPNFEAVYKEIVSFFAKNFFMKNMKIMTYDIEDGIQKILFLTGENFDENDHSSVFSYDFSKSYAINGRLYFQTIDQKSYNELQEDKVFLSFIFYELRHIFLYFLTIEKLKESSFVDDTTKLPNRKFLINHFRSVLEIAKKENIQIGFLKVDIDRFKAVIEEFNYDISNKVLQTLSKILVKNITKTDIVTILEDNSFLISVQDMKDRCELSALAQKCIDDFAKEFVIVDPQTNQKLHKTICIGISLYPQDGETLDQLIKNSDIALDEAKNKGRSSYNFFDQLDGCEVSLF